MGTSKQSGLASVSQGRSDLFRLDPRVLKVRDGWNCRDLGAQDTREHIEGLALSIAEVGVKEPLTVFWEDGAAWVSDGHCRLKATLLAIKNGADIKTVPVKSEERHANDADRLFSQVIRNSGKPFSALESAKVYQKLLGYGWTQAEIAKKAGVSQARVSQVLELLTLPEGVKQMVSAGQVSPSLAVAAVAEHSSAKAENILKGAVAAAKEEGRTKAKASDVVSKKATALTVVKDAFDGAEYNEHGDIMVVTFSAKEFEKIRQALKL